MSTPDPALAAAGADADDTRYVGFWARVLAAIIDSVLVSFLIVPVVGLLFGWEQLGAGAPRGAGSFVVNLFLPAVAIVAFWLYKSATPGKMVIGAEIVDAASMGRPTRAQFVGRYLGYYVSSLPFALGLIWVAFDGRKQGWHDKLAGTVVVYRRARG